MALVYAMVLLTVMMAFGSLAVDYGRVQMAKTQLQTAADAAARAAAASISSGTSAATTAAQTVAGYNEVEGAAISISASDVVCGNYASGVFTANGSPSNAVQVTTHRTSNAGGGGGIPLIWGSLIGRSTCDVWARSICYTQTAGGGYGIVGLNGININAASAWTAEYNSNTGVYTTGASSTQGCIASNGNFNLNNNCSVAGTIYYYGASAPTGAKDVVARTRMTNQLSYPAPTAGAAVTSNSNALIGYPTTNANVNVSGNVTWPGGTYNFNSLNIPNTATVTFSGPAVVYVNGNVSIDGTVNTYQTKPINLQINVTAAAGVNLTNNVDLFAVIYAPTSPANLNPNGTHGVVGSLIASQLSLSGNARIYYDTALGTNNPSAGGTPTIIGVQ